MKRRQSDETVKIKQNGQIFFINRVVDNDNLSSSGVRFVSNVYCGYANQSNLI